MNDREMLEMAANVAFPDRWEWNGVNQCIEILHSSGYYTKWKPLEDSGAALQLAVALGFEVDIHRLFQGAPWICPWTEVRGGESRRVLATKIAADNGASLEAATRRAIVKAAAVIEREKGGSA